MPQQAARVVILTAISVEFKAIKAKLRATHPEIDGGGTVYTVGLFEGAQPWEVVLAEVGAGNVGAALHAERAINWFQPNLIMFVGIAGGLKDVKLGDVVAADKVYAYEHGKDGRSFVPRPFTGLSKHRLVDHARYVASSDRWRARLGQWTDGDRPTAFVGPVAAGEKVLASTRGSTFSFLRNTYSDALAVEMEGVGLLMAAHFNDDLPAIVIRGVSDRISNKRPSSDVRWQPLAARAASAFAFEFLSSFGSGSVSGPVGPGPQTVPPYWTRTDPGTRNLFRGIQTPPSVTGIRSYGRVSVGEILEGQFGIDRLIAQGTFGDVYLGHQRLGGADLGPVAIKVHHRAEEDAFQREIAVLAELHHPNLIALRGAGRVEDRTGEVFFFTATDWADFTLQERLRGGPMVYHEVIRLGLDMAEGLQFAHNSGFIHGDLKPANVLRMNDRWVLGDFGLARQAGIRGPGESADVVGTPAYMAPERFTGGLGFESDIYSLGLVLLVALGARPSPTGETTLGAILRTVATNDIIVPETIPEPLRRILQSALSVGPSSRPSAREVRDSLAELDADRV